MHKIDMNGLDEFTKAVREGTIDKTQMSAEELENFEKIEKAILEGKVIGPAFAEDEIVLTDGHVKFFFNPKVEHMENRMSLTVYEAGSWSGILFSLEQWEHMKKRVDALIAKSVANRPVD